PYSLPSTLSVDPPHLHPFPTRRSSDLRHDLRQWNRGMIGEPARAEEAGLFALVRDEDDRSRGLLLGEALGDLEHDDGARAVIVGDRKSNTSELQSRGHLVCRLLLEKKK